MKSQMKITVSNPGVECEFYDDIKSFTVKYEEINLVACNGKILSILFSTKTMLTVYDDIHYLHISNIDNQDNFINRIANLHTNRFLLMKDEQNIIMFDGYSYRNSVLLKVQEGIPKLIPAAEPEVTSLDDLSKMSTMLLGKLYESEYLIKSNGLKLDSVLERIKSIELNIPEQ